MFRTAALLLILASTIAISPRAEAQTLKSDQAEPSDHALKRTIAAADRAEIVELSARFDNSLDAEDAKTFLAVFVPDGELVGFWGTSKGPAGLRKAFDFMLATFAKHKRHVVTNHVISIDGGHAKMTCYLTVFDRDRLAVTGTATFTDELVRQNGEWKFARRTLVADPNVDPIIQSLQGTKQ